jgi:streptogramin lyase
MRRFSGLLIAAGLVAAFLWVGVPVQTQTGSPSSAGLRGTVKSSDGKPLEGVPVSAKAQGSTMTTSVWTNQNGEYYFPQLPNGQYRMWAQAVGFELTRAEHAIVSGKPVQQNFTLPVYKDAWRQLSDIEWLDSLPDETAADRKMKRILLYNCGTCHNNGYVLEKRFARADWELLVNHMSKISSTTDPADNVPGGGKFDKPILDEDGKPLGAQRRILDLYKKDIIDFLTRVRGPEPFPLKLKLLPRPTGEAANIVVTEYDIPEGGTIGRLDPKTGHITQFNLNRDDSTTRVDKPEYYNHDYRNGTDWSRGLRVMYQENTQHDVIVGTDGYVYLPPGIGVGLDPSGNVWFAGDGAIKLDIKTEKLTRYPLPQGWEGFNNGKDVDSKGNFWGATMAGFYRLEPQTGKWTLFPAVTPIGRPYGLTIDAEDKVWIAQIAVDKIAWVDGRTGDVGEVALPPIDDEDLSAADRAINRGWTMNQALYSKGPRRLRGDRNPNGKYVWIGEYFGGRLGRIDIRTKALTEYKLPGPFRFANPYEPAIDKNGTVWLGFANADYFAKFDPVTERFTLYPLPSRGHNARHIDVDSKPDVPEVWVPYAAAAKVARVQFRTNPAR